MLAFAQIALGFLMLVAGGEVVVKGAVGLAKKLGISTVVIGLTIVAFGTSAPEAMISLQAAITDHPDIAIGNVIGSNLANMLLVVGATALLWPIATHKALCKRDGTVMTWMAVLLVLMATDGVITRMDGIIMFSMVVLYTLFTVYDAKNEEKDSKLVEELEEETNVSLPLYLSITMIGAGIALLAIGSDTLIKGATTLATASGISEAVIGVTIVAIGGSAPELVTSLVAAWRKHADIGLANIVGSNIFNVAGVIGIAGTVAPMSVAPQFLNFDIWLMLGVTVAFFVAMLALDKIGRALGGVFTAGYVVYVIWQYMGVA